MFLRSYIEHMFNKEYRVKSDNVIRLGERSDLWSHVVKHTEQAPLLWTRRNVTEVICSLYLTVPESVGELQCNLQNKKHHDLHTHSTSCICTIMFCTMGISVHLLDDSGPQTVYGFELPVWKRRVKLNDVLL